MTIYVGSIVLNPERRIRYFPRFATSARRGALHARYADEVIE